MNCIRHPFRHIATAALLATSLASAHAASVTFSSNPLPVQLTDWASFADLQQFDPSQGQLQQVTLALFGDLSGSARAESRNNFPSTITLNLQATLALVWPGIENANAGAVLVQTTPIVSSVFNAAARDNVLDFGGASGVTLNNLAAASSTQASFSDPATLALFTGSGLVSLPFSASGQSFADGPGNLGFGFTTLAGGYAQVTYDFLPSPVPEPATWALLLGGVALMRWLVLRRAA